MCERFRTILMILIVCVSFNISAEESVVKGVQAQSLQALAILQNWQNTSLKQTLKNRINENQYLLNFLSEVELIQSDSNIDDAFAYEVTNLINDQKGLVYFSKNIAIITDEASLDLDSFFAGNVRLKKSYLDRLMHKQGKTSSKLLVNGLLYTSFMAKYADI